LVGDEVRNGEGVMVMLVVESKSAANDEGVTVEGYYHCVDACQFEWMLDTLNVLGHNPSAMDRFGKVQVPD